MFSQRLLIPLFILSVLISCAQEENVRLNQVGFYPGGPKVAIVANRGEGGKFFIVTEKKNDTVFTGTLSDQRRSAYSSANTRLADFSSLKKTGKYFLTLEGLSLIHI